MLDVNLFREGTSCRVVVKYWHSNSLVSDFICVALQAADVWLMCCTITCNAIAVQSCSLTHSQLSPCRVLQAGGESQTSSGSPSGAGMQMLPWSTGSSSWMHTGVMVRAACIVHMPWPAMGGITTHPLMLASSGVQNGAAEDGVQRPQQRDRPAQKGAFSAIRTFCAWTLTLCEREGGRPSTEASSHACCSIIGCCVSRMVLQLAD